MREDQFNKLTDYIEAVVKDGIAGPEGLFENVAMNKKRKELYDSFFNEQEETDENIGKNYIIKSLKEENEISLGLLEETSNILCKMPGESVTDAARRVMRSRGEHFDFFNSLLDPEQYGWAVNEEIRNEARVFLGIPKVKIKR
jgi:hypothetical protein